MNRLPLEVQLLISLVAEGRILGTSWGQLASELQRSVTELQSLKFLYPEEWTKQMNTAHEEYQKAGVNQAIRHLGELMASDDLKLKEKATATMARLFATQERAEQRRFKERNQSSRLIPTPAVPPAETPANEPIPPLVNAATPPEPGETPNTSASNAPNNTPPKPARTPRESQHRLDRNGFPLLC